MPAIKVELEDKIFWHIYGWAAREQCKAHELAARLIVRAAEADMQAREPAQTAQEAS